MCSIIVLVSFLPIAAEAVSAVHGQHVWSLESVGFLVLPVVALTAATALLIRVRHGRTVLQVIVCGIVSMLVALAGCVPVTAFFFTLLVDSLS